MANYGIGYRGSKGAIAKYIIDRLPNGERFVDLFGGGFAMSHYALLSGKYKKVFYNEINPLLTDLIKKAINGDFNYKNFKPKFISREEFFKNKDKDGYIKYVWSFGCGGNEYMFGEIENYKRVCHNAVVFGELSDEFKKMFPNFSFTQSNINERRLELRKYIGSLYDYKKGNDFENKVGLQQLQQLQQLERLQRLQQLQRLERLEINNGSYLDYIYQKGDIVYCDIPYENTGGYNNTSFNHEEFYNWVKTRPYTVYFSSYPLSEARIKEFGFIPIWEKEKRQKFSATNNSKKMLEVVYTNNDIKRKWFNYKQLNLLEKR